MITTFKKVLYLLPLIAVLAVLPLQNGICGCVVEGGVCGDPPNWEPCCNPDKLECEKEKDSEYGTCVPKKEEVKEEVKKEE